MLVKHHLKGSNLRLEEKEKEESEGQDSPKYMLGSKGEDSHKRKGKDEEMENYFFYKELERGKI